MIGVSVSRIWGRVAAAWSNIQAWALQTANDWWKIAAGWVVTSAIFTSGVYLPIRNHTATDLTALAALVASLTPLVAAHAWERTRGGGDGGDTQ